MSMKPIPIVTMAFLAVSPLTFANPTRVLGKWSDGYWYPARVQSVKGENINLNYDDGDVGTVTPDRLAGRHKTGMQLEKSRVLLSRSYYSNDRRKDYR